MKLDRQLAYPFAGRVEYRVVVVAVSEIRVTLLEFLLDLLALLLHPLAFGLHPRGHLSYFSHALGVARPLDAALGGLPVERRVQVVASAAGLASSTTMRLASAYLLCHGVGNPEPGISTG